jgi:hypothetical protein
VQHPAERDLFLVRRLQHLLFRGQFCLRHRKPAQRCKPVVVFQIHLTVLLISLPYRLPPYRSWLALELDFPMQQQKGPHAQPMV